MSNGMRDTLKTILLTIVIVLVAKSVRIFPWWAFIIPVTALGFVISWQNWKVHCFLTGFLSGFLIWIGSTIYFDSGYSGDLSNRIGTVPNLILLILGGLIGGLLTGLALYTGRSILVLKTDQPVL